MKKLDFTQMENLQGGSVKQCNYVGSVLLLLGVAGSSEGWGIGVALFGAGVMLGCAAYDY